MIILGSLDSA